MFGSWLLAILAVTSIAILVGGRMAEQTRRVGLLKAVGATPGLVTLRLLSETLLLALGGLVFGLLAGSLRSRRSPGPSSLAVAVAACSGSPRACLHRCRWRCGSSAARPGARRSTRSG